jgi:WD40 repeat protein
MRNNVDDHSGVIRVWDLATGKLRVTLPRADLPPWRENQGAQLKSIAVVDDDRVIASYRDAALRIWDVRRGEHLGTWRLGGRGLRVAVHGKRAVSASDDGMIRIWDLDTGTEISHHDMPAGRVVALGFVGEAMVAVHAASSTSISHVQGERIESSFTDSRPILSMSITSPPVVASDGTVTLAFADAVVVQNARGQSTEYEMPHAGPAAAVGGRLIGTINQEGAPQLVIVDRVTGQRRVIPTQNCTSGLALSPDGHWAATAHTWEARTIVLWDLESGAAVKTWKKVPGESCTVAISTSGSIVLNTQGNIVNVWSTKHAAPTKLVMPSTRARILAIAFESETVACAIADGMLVRWDLANGEALTHTTIPPYAVSLAIRSNIVAIGAVDGTIWTGAIDTSTNVAQASPRALPFALEPSFEELVGGSLRLGDYDDPWALIIEYESSIHAAEKQAIEKLYAAWGKRLIRASVHSEGHRSEASAMKAGIPLARIYPLSIEGKHATGGASRIVEARSACVWLVEQLAKRKGILRVTFGEKDTPSRTAES